MDAVEMIPPVTPVILGLLSIFMLGISTYFAMPWLIAMIGNARVERSLNLFKEKGAMVLNHLLLADKKGDIIHIDHLIITNRQIIALSILGYSGEILGSVRGRTWIQETRQGSYRFPNPLIHHEAIRRLLHGILGERLEVKTISAFTSGRLQGDDSEEVVSAQACARVIGAAVEETASGSRQQWASNIIQNVRLEDRRNTERERSFISQQGNEKYLKIARYLTTGSALLMLLAMTAAGLRLATNYGLL